MALNYKTYFIDSTEIAARQAEVPDADFEGGMNKGGSNTCGIGINTGDYDPKPSDWKPPVGVPTEVQQSQYIGGPQSGILVIDPALPDDNEVTAFVTATADVAPDGVIESVAGFDMLNRTGKTIPTGSSAWGVGSN